MGQHGRNRKPTPKPQGMICNTCGKKAIARIRELNEFVCRECLVAFQSAVIQIAEEKGKPAVFIQGQLGH